MDTSFLKSWTRLGGLGAVSAMMACSLVVDTDECASSADCEFGDGVRMECIANECVPSSSVRQALVPESIETNQSLDASHRWALDGVVVIESNATLTIEAGAQIETRPTALIVVMEGGSLRLMESRPDLAPYVIDENRSEAP